MQIGQRIRPRCIRARFRTTEESSADLDRARAQSQRGGDPSPFCDTTRSDNRNREFVRQAWQQGKKADTLTLRSRLIKRASMAAGFAPLRYDGIGSGALRLSCLSQSRCALQSAFRFQSVKECCVGV